MSNENDEGREDVFAEIENGEYTASIILAPDEAMDGWLLRVFPTLVRTRVILGINKDWAQEVVDQTQSMDEVKQFEEELLEESTRIVHNYFVANDAR